MEPIIKLEDFHRTYQTGSVEVLAVRGVSLEIHAGEFVAVMGASGTAPDEGPTGTSACAIRR